MQQLKIIAVVALLLLVGCSTTITGKDFKSEKKDPAKEYYNLGIKYMQSGRFDLAEGKLQRSIEKERTPEALNALALLYEEIHDNQLAESTYKMLIEEFSAYGLGYSNYNVFLCKYDRTQQIASLAQKMAVQGNQMAALGQIAAGDCAVSKGAMQTAKQHYNKALSYEQYAAGALLPLAEIDLRDGFVKEAEAKIGIVHNYIGYSARSLYVAVLAARERGDRLLERKMTRELRTRFANSPEARTIGVR